VPERWRSWYLLNPMVGIVDSFRRAVLDGLAPDPSALGWSLVVTVIALPMAYAWFRHVDATLADVI
jgi:lipopolysaccharide transport system permease protein